MNKDIRPECHCYTDEQLQFLNDNYKGIPTDKLVQLFNAKFNTSLTYSQIRSVKKRRGLKSGYVTVFQKGKESYPRGVGYQHRYTKEQKEWIYDHRSLTNYNLAEQFNKHFNVTLTDRNIEAYKHRHGLSGAPRGSNSHRFKPSFPRGHIPPKTVAIGTERVTSMGYLQIKDKEGHKAKNFVFKHRKIYEEHKGPIPDGYIVTFADGDTTNFELDNLVLISRKQNAVINKVLKRRKNSEVLDSQLLLADLIIETKRRKEK